MSFKVTVRYGSRHQQYHTFEVDAGSVVEALRAAADAIPDHIVDAADLVEVRPAVRPDDREYLGEGNA